MSRILIKDPVELLQEEFSHQAQALQDFVMPFLGHRFSLQPSRPDIADVAKNALSWRKIRNIRPIGNTYIPDQLNWIWIHILFMSALYRPGSKVKSLGTTVRRKVINFLQHEFWIELAATLRESLSGANIYLQDQILEKTHEPSLYQNLIFMAFLCIIAQQEPEATSAKSLFHELWLKGNYPIALDFDNNFYILCQFDEPCVGRE